MNPARTTRSTRCFRSTWTTSRSNASRSFPKRVWSVTTAATPCFSARATTGAPGTLETRTATSAPSVPRSFASTRLSKSVPRPDARTPTLIRAMWDLSMLEQPQPGEGHRDPVLVRGGDHLVVPDRSSGLRDRGDPSLPEFVEPVSERKVRVAHRDAPLRCLPGLVAREHTRVHAAHLPGADADRPLPVREHDRVRLHVPAHADPERHVPELVRRGLRAGDDLPGRRPDLREVRRLEQDASKDVDHVEPVVAAELAAG